MNTLLSALLAAGLAIQSAQAPDSVHLVVVATTDVHGRVFHWDYVRDGEAPFGLTRAATVVDSLRDLYPGRVIVVDAGDLIQGNPFATYFAEEQAVDPHPVVDALNAVGFDAATPGNHEFNWGLDVFARVIDAAAFPVVSANLYRLPRDTLALPPFALVPRGGVRVGITGFTTPGAMVWDRANLAGRLRVHPILPNARRVLEDLADAGADLRVAVIHSGMGGASSYDTTGVGAENVAAGLAALPVKPHLVVVGHTHRTITDSVIDGVHFIQPPPHARGLAVAHVWLVSRWPRSHPIPLCPGA
jgi:2',3'-cyclic-nucleotide 2'-phosphodiesterase/3'-nucleotidase